MKDKQTSKETDSFYTKSEIAERFVKAVDDLVDLSSFDLVLEPSAGNGRILEHLPKHNRQGLDLHPERDDIIEQNFFDYQPPHKIPLLLENPSIAVVGNPPFGRSSKLAIEFFKHAAEFADVIAFIIPRSWMKFSVQNRLPKGWDLMYSAVLPDEAFTFMDKSYSVRCVAQVWIKEGFRPDITGFGKVETWNDDVPEEHLKLIYDYYHKHGCVVNAWS